MDRPRREDFETFAAYRVERDRFVEYAINREGRLKGTLESALARMTAIEDYLKPSAKTPLDQLRAYAADLIADRYTLADQANITRKAARAGPALEDMIALEEMDNFIDAVRAGYRAHKKVLLALTETEQQAYDLSQGWPKEV